MDEVAKQIVSAFDEMYPNAHCELEHRNHFELLVAVMLSAQTTDKSVNKVTKSLFEKYKTPQDFAKASLEEIEQAIKQLGLYKNKAKNLKKMSQMLIDDFNVQVPEKHVDLVKLPGVGRKTANVVLSVAFNEPAFAVDTHVERVSKRLNIAAKDDSVLTVEKKLNAFFPKALWNKLHHQMIFFGRYHCLSRKPNCHKCPLKMICRYYKENENK
ncbi:endonuclease III [Mycoplasmatota bacterium]|nr:endonuclease III [Mycoplasmatota bacterium]